MNFHQIIKRVFLISFFCACHSAIADPLEIAKQPLQTAGNSVVLPNLMYILDDSRSMYFTYTPDWVAMPRIATNYLRFNSEYNTQYYNPNITYIPAVKADGVSMGNQGSPWTAVKNAVNHLGSATNTLFYDCFDSSSSNCSTRTNGSTYASTTSNLVGNASYYTYVAGEYCTRPDLKNCVATTAATATHTYPARIRWCNSSAAAKTYNLTTGQLCQSTRVDAATVNDTNTYTNFREPLATYTLTFSTSVNSTVSSIKINNIEILRANVSSNSGSGLASLVRNNICTSSITSTRCVVNNVNVTSAGSTVTFRTPIGRPVNPANANNPIVVTMTAGSSTSAVVTPRTVSGDSDVPGSLVFVNIASTNNSYVSPGSTVKSPDRTDCAGNVCTYAEEMTNFANWHTYYKTRMQAMKTSTSLAFKDIDLRYRVGFVTIANNNYLAINQFTTTQKNSWYEKLFTTGNNNVGTPLRQALANTGKHFAGKKIYGQDDPVQYACQPNFALLTTDGYWNDSTTPTNLLGSTIGNLDGNAGGTVTPRPLFDSSNVSNTLADTAKYFYDTDIRQSNFNNCTNNSKDVCGSESDHDKQNMVTMTLGLGIDGTLLYSEDYETQSVGDFKDLRAPDKKNWPNPSAENGTRIDDLWHAAVNAGGTYYSAKNPKLLRESLSKGLAQIKAVAGASAAAAASSLTPTSGDNFQYVASYQTVQWTGNLESRTVNTQTFETSQTATWCVENVAATACVSPAKEERILSDNTTSLYCRTDNSDETSCANAGGELGLAGQATSCFVEIASSCTGRLQAQVATGTLNPRKIFVNKNGALTPFDAGNLTSTQTTELTDGYLNLSQMKVLPATDPKITDPLKVSKLLDYLSGKKTFEDIGSNPTAANRLFRQRQGVLGDITQSRPAYYKKSNANYKDNGYTAYKNASVSRQAAVYVGANDGMLHAFDASTGDELWAYIPTPVFKNLANLADKEYGFSYHTNYVNGSPTVADVCISGCNGSGAVWRTILVSGLNGGGRGYFALDVTNPTSPTLLWEFIAKDSDPHRNIGLSFGNPIITKLANGNWVVVVTSGYNNGAFSGERNTNNNQFIVNTPAGDGKGYLFVLNANNGSIVRSISTNNGDAFTPSGLSRISNFADNIFENNMSSNIYGGDLNGNLWRFDINAGTAVKIANLSSGSTAQKITTYPALGKVDGKRVIMVGTGKFLENNDIDLANSPVNSIYGIKDDNLTSPISSTELTPRSIVSNGGTRSITGATSVFSTGLGWRVDLPAGERVNVDPLLLNNVLNMPSVVPSSASCDGAAYGWFNYLNYKTGGSVFSSGIVSEKLNAPSVGFNVMYNSKGEAMIANTASNDATPELLKFNPLNEDETQSVGDHVLDKNKGGGYGTKHSWRELIYE